MKVFISHKQEDSDIAKHISLMLSAYKVENYLDILDSSISGNGKELTDHVRAALNQCTDILVVMSERTRYSQWVPFEIGMAAEKFMPTVTYLTKDVPLPDFLSFWPRLSRYEDIGVYIRTRKEAEQQIEIRSRIHYMTAETRKAEMVKQFYDTLKSSLR